MVLLPDAHSRDQGLEDLVAKMLLELVRDLLRQRHARVKHDAQQTDYLQVRIQVGRDFLDGIGKIGQTFQRIVFALHGDDHAMGGAQAIQSQQRQGWRTVDENEVIVSIDLGQSFTQAFVAVIQRDHFHFCTCKFTVGRENIKAPRF